MTTQYGLIRLVCSHAGGKRQTMMPPIGMLPNGELDVVWPGWKPPTIFVRGGFDPDDLEDMSDIDDYDYLFVD